MDLLRREKKRPERLQRKRVSSADHFSTPGVFSDSDKTPGTAHLLRQSSTNGRPGRGRLIRKSSLPDVASMGDIAGFAMAAEKNGLTAADSIEAGTLKTEQGKQSSPGQLCSSAAPGQISSLLHLVIEKPQVTSCSSLPWSQTGVESGDTWDEFDCPAPERQISSNAEKEFYRAAAEHVAEIAAEVIAQRKRRKERRHKKLKPRFQSWGGALSAICEGALKGMPAIGMAIRRQDIIIFDWDDTLFPTWHVAEVIWPCSEFKYDKLPEESPFHGAMKAHAALVSEILTAASKVAKVFIVTLSQNPWVLNSAGWFLPGVCLPDLLQELDIGILYAREHVFAYERRAAFFIDGVDLYTVAKRRAMKKCVTRALRGSTFADVNVISVGDAKADMDAIKEVIWANDVDKDLCKTVKFLPEPTLQALTAELQVLKGWLPPLLEYEKDIDVNMADPSSSSVMQTMTED